MSTKYYVYAYFDGETPIYIGAGSEERMWKHMQPSTRLKTDRRFYGHLNKMLDEGRLPGFATLAEGLTRKESFFLETFFILAVGRRDNPVNPGPLLNVAGGGAGRRDRRQVCPACRGRGEARKAAYIRVAGINNQIYFHRSKGWLAVTPDGIIPVASRAAGLALLAS